MGPVNLILWAGGAALMWLGYIRARGPWARYQDLKAQDANVARYQSWRGGIRDDDVGTTGASVAMAILRRQVQIGAAIGVGGLIAIVLGFVIR